MAASDSEKVAAAILTQTLIQGLQQEGSGQTNTPSRFSALVVKATTGDLTEGMLKVVTEFYEKMLKVVQGKKN